MHRAKKENEQNDWYREASIELENMLNKVTQSTEIDDKLLFETLHNSTVVPTFCATNEEGVWTPYHNAPGISATCGVLFYDAANNTLYTDSAIHDFTYSCEVKYFDGSYLIMEGLFAPIDDVYNNDYAERKFLREFKQRDS